MGDVVKFRKVRVRKRERITPEALGKLIARHSCCVLDQKQRCPLQLFLQPMCWELNVFFGVASKEDEGFRRCSDMVAAQPLERALEEARLAESMDEEEPE